MFIQNALELEINQEMSDLECRVSYFSESEELSPLRLLSGLSILCVCAFPNRLQMGTRQLFRVQ